MALPIRRREVVRRSDPGGEAHRFSLRVRLPSLVPSREEAVALRLREHVIFERMHGPETLSSETALLAALRCGDEDAFSALVDAYGAAMHRVALTFVRSSAVADEVVQEAWLGALRGLDRFEGPDERHPQRWVSFPMPWSTEPDSALLSAETRKLIADTIAGLPEGQRIVISLRDVEGWDSAEVCSVLELSETNQRVLLHRARSKVRAALERYLTTESP